MNVLSLFDGISCAQIALNRANIKVNNYYASEIDKFSIQVTKHHYPNTLFLGDVCSVDTNQLPKIDLLIGGSPCQGFSLMGKMLNFNDHRSKLFFEYLRILQECSPAFFVLENVKMPDKYANAISRALGVNYICINSSLVSAQQRTRYYWTNIPNVATIQDKGIVIRDILSDVGPYRYWTQNQIYKMHKKQYRGALANRVENIDGKCRCLLANEGNLFRPKIWDSVGLRWLTPLEWERLQTIPDNYTHMLSRTQRYKQIGNAFTVDVIVHILQHMENTDAKR